MHEWRLEEMSVVAPANLAECEPRYPGLRMSADEYFALPNDGFWYELVDGLVCMSPSPTPRHQVIATEIVGQIWAFLRDHPVGRVYCELDVNLGKGPGGGDLVYRPDVMFIRAERLANQKLDRVRMAPDLIVEVVSSASGAYDRRTKFGDYERHEVGEYWIIDPQRGTWAFHRLEGGRYVEVKASRDQFASTAIPGFVLDLLRVRELFAD